MEPVNVFGGKGFIGSHFVKECDGCVVNDRDDYAVYSNNIVYFISTVTNYNVFTDPFIDVDTNLTTLLKVLNNITDKENTVFNFISSWFVYGNTEMPAKETSYCDPKGFYSITKRTAEQLLISYCETFNIKYRILRLANVIGPNDTKASARKNAIVHMIGQLKNHQPIKLYEGGRIYRDIIGVDDCVRAINLVIDKGELNAIYNIGNGKPTELYEVIMTAKDIFNSNSQIDHIDTPQFHSTVQVKSMYMDTTKLQSLGYTPRQTLVDIVRQV